MPDSDAAKPHYWFMSGFWTAAFTILWLVGLVGTVYVLVRYA